MMAAVMAVDKAANFVVSVLVAWIALFTLVVSTLPDATALGGILMTNDATTPPAKRRDSDKRLATERVTVT